MSEKKSKKQQTPQHKKGGKPKKHQEDDDFAFLEEEQKKQQQKEKQQAESTSTSNTTLTAIPNDAGVFEAGKLKQKEVLPTEMQVRLQEVIHTVDSKFIAEKEKEKAKEQEKGRTGALEGMNEHKFWDTQPVPVLGSSITAEFNNPINPDSKPEDVPKTPQKLPDGYYWCTVDISNPDQLKESYTLLCENYVEDDDNMFRFDYSPEFLRWALTPPGSIPNWIVGIRSNADNALSGFITGIPVTLRMHDRAVKMAEINFLCVHKKLRALRLAPMLIAEVTRRVHLEGMFQAVYTAGVLLPTPIATCRYYHRSLNPKKLVEVGFSSLNSRMTIARALKLYRMNDQPSTPGIRPMKLEDVPQVRRLLGSYLEKFKFTPVFNEEEIAHWLLPREKVVYSYVVENPASKVITGFTSFYSLPSSIIGNAKYKTLNAAYFFYTVNTVGTIADLVSDALIFAKNAGFDVYNALDLMENSSFLKDLKFGIGDGELHYYLYNWACPQVQSKDIGIVLL